MRSRAWKIYSIAKNAPTTSHDSRSHNVSFREIEALIVCWGWKIYFPSRIIVDRASRFVAINENSTIRRVIFPAGRYDQILESWGGRKMGRRLRDSLPWDGSWGGVSRGNRVVVDKVDSTLVILPEKRIQTRNVSPSFPARFLLSLSTFVPLERGGNLDRWRYFVDSLPPHFPPHYLIPAGN